MTSFSSALTTLGQTGVTGFINSFHNAESRVKAAASSMISVFINGANAKKPELTTTFNTLVQAVLAMMNGKQGEFQTSGSTLMAKFIAGVRSQDLSLIHILSRVLECMNHTNEPTQVMTDMASVMNCLLYTSLPKPFFR